MSTFDITVCTFVGVLFNTLFTAFMIVVGSPAKRAALWGFGAALVAVAGFVVLGCLAPQPHGLCPVIAPMIIFTALANALVRSAVSSAAERI